MKEIPIHSSIFDEKYDLLKQFFLSLFPSTLYKGWPLLEVGVVRRSPPDKRDQRVRACVCMCGLCIRWALMGGVSSQTSAHCSRKCQKAPHSGCAMPSSAVSAHCGWGSSEAFLGRGASSGLSGLALGEMLPISHVSSGITSPSQGSPQLLVAIVLYHLKRAAPSPHRSGDPMDPSPPGVTFVLALCAVTLLLLSGRPRTAAPSFTCAKHQWIRTRRSFTGRNSFGFFYHEGKPLITTHSNCSQRRENCSESSFLHLFLWDEGIADWNSQTYIGLLDVHLSKTYPLFLHNWISIFL